jgi:hypothetical protein
MRNLKFYLYYFLTALPVLASCQIEFADAVIDQFYSNANPDFSDFYGNNGTTDLCNVYLVDVGDFILGNNDSLVAITENSSITLAFTDNLVFDAVDQDDLFVEEIGGGQEFGELYVSPDGINFTFLDMLNGATLNSFDLNDYAYDDVVKAVRIVGGNTGGCIPGLDVSRVFGVEGANCLCGADLAPFPFELCNQDTLVSLETIPLQGMTGQWIGPGVEDNSFNPLGLEGTVTLQYLVNFGHPVCPVDTVDYQVTLSTCDCAGVLNGLSTVDDCGVCLEPGDPQFNQSCLDCAGLLNGPGLIDTCGVCLDPSDPLFGMSCFDCMGVPEGQHIIDLCGDCLLASDPLFNLGCPERFRVYIPTIFNPGSGGLDESFGIQFNPENIGQLVRFEVYDRWGSLLFQILDTPLVEVDQWWDGRFAGSVLESGAYSYQYHITYPEMAPDIGVGTLVLIK